jgi:small subunit ribosomal protein S17
MTQATTQANPQADTGANEGAAARIGVVESDRRDKTRKVVVRFQARHPKYGKFIKRRTVLHVHDESNESRLGDIVEVAQCRPISKTKSWRLVRVVERRSTEQV